MIVYHYSQEISLKSSRLAPFRSHTRGYTGQAKSTLNENSRATNETLNKFKSHLELLSQKPFNIDEFELSQTIRGHLFLLFDTIFTSNVIEEGKLNIELIQSTLKEFFKFVGSYFLKLKQIAGSVNDAEDKDSMKSRFIGFINLYPEIIEILGLIFTKNNRTDVMSSKEKPSEKLAANLKPSFKNLKEWASTLLVEFKILDGLKEATEMTDKINRASFKLLIEFINFFKKIDNPEDCVRVFSKAIIESFIKRVEAFNEVDVEELQYEDIKKIFELLPFEMKRKYTLPLAMQFYGSSKIKKRLIAAQLIEDMSRGYTFSSEDKIKIFTLIFENKDFHASIVKAMPNTMMAYVEDKDFSEKMINLMWECSLKYEDLSKLFFTLLSKSLTRMGFEQQKKINEKINNISTADFTETIISFIKAFKSNSFQYKNAKEDISDLGVLWKLIESNKNKTTFMLAIDALVELKKESSTIYDACLSNIKEKIHPLISSYIFIKSIPNFIVNPSKLLNESITNVIIEIMEITTENSKELDDTDALLDYTYTQKLTHYCNVIHAFIQVNAKCIPKVEHIDSLWDKMFIKGKNDEQEIFSKFLLKEAPVEKYAYTYEPNQRKFLIMENKSMKEFFSKVVCQSPIIDNPSAISLHLFSSLFMFSNEPSFEPKRSEMHIRIKDVTGTNMLWDMLINANNDNLKKEISNKLLSLYVDISPRLIEASMKDIIKKSLEYLDKADSNESKKLTTLQILRQYKASFWLPPNCSPPVMTVNYKFDSEPCKLELNKNIKFKDFIKMAAGLADVPFQDIEYGNYMIGSENKPLYLLEKSMPFYLKSGDANYTDINTILSDPNNLNKMLPLLNDKSEELVQQIWNFIIDIDFKDCSYKKDLKANWYTAFEKLKDAYYKIAFVLHLFVKNKEEILGKVVDEAQLKKLINFIKDGLIKCSKKESYIFEAIYSGYVQLLDKILVSFKKNSSLMASAFEISYSAILSKLNSYGNQCNFIAQDIDNKMQPLMTAFDVFKQTLSDCNDESTSKISEILKLISKIKNPIAKNYLISKFTEMIHSKINEKCILQIYDVFFGVIKANNSDEMCKYFAKLIKTHSPRIEGKLQETCKECIAIFNKELQQKNCIYGIAKLCRRCVAPLITKGHLNGDIKDMLKTASVDIIQTLYPKTINKLSKDKEIQKQLWKFLYLVSKVDDLFIAEKIKTSIIEIRLDEHWRVENDWLIDPIQCRETKFGGLVNKGTMCYCNSALQQLYMVPEFRKLIIETPVHDNLKENSALANVKKTFILLNNSIIPYIQTTNVIKTLLIEGRMLSENEQKDVDEFMTVLVESIEKDLSCNMDNLKTLHDLFQGQQVNEFIPNTKECTHKREHPENFFAISMQVKGKQNLVESLNEYIKGELLEGDNSYLCEDCNKKVPVIKRMCFKKLPNYIIFSLKRFDYNLEDGLRIKLNDRYEFPNDIDLKPYMQSTLNQDNSDIESESVKDDEASYKFILTGVVLHTGDVNAGHYHSLIKDNGKWVEFNDEIVREYIGNFQEDAFGGIDDEQDYNEFNISASQKKEISMRTRNAYLLIYKSVKSVNSNYSCNPSASLKLFSSKEDQKLAIKQLLFNQISLTYCQQILCNELPKLSNYTYEQLKKTNLHESASLCPEFSVHKFSFVFYFTILMRSKIKDTKCHMDKYELLCKLLRSNLCLSMWLLEEFTTQDILLEYFQSCPPTNIGGRQCFAHLLKIAFEIVWEKEEKLIRESSPTKQSKSSTYFFGKNNNHPICYLHLSALLHTIVAVYKEQATDCDGLFMLLYNICSISNEVAAYVQTFRVLGLCMEILASIWKEQDNFAFISDSVILDCSTAYELKREINISNLYQKSSMTYQLATLNKVLQ